MATTNPRQKKQLSPSDIDQGWAWIVLAGMCMWNALVIGLFNSSGILYLEYRALFDGGAVETGWIASSFALADAVAAPIGGHVSNSFSAKTMRIVAMVFCVLSSLCLLGTAWAPSLAVTIVLFALAGAFFGCIDGYVLSHLLKYFQKRRFMASGMAFAGSGIGSLVLPLLVTALIAEFGLRGTLLILAGLWLHTVAVVSTLKKPLRSNHSPTHIGEISMDIEVRVDDAPLETTSRRRSDGDQAKDSTVVMCHNGELTCRDCISNGDTSDATSVGPSDAQPTFSADLSNKSIASNAVDADANVEKHADIRWSPSKQDRLISEQTDAADKKRTGTRRDADDNPHEGDVIDRTESPKPCQELTVNEHSSEETQKGPTASHRKKIARCGCSGCLKSLKGYWSLLTSPGLPSLLLTYLSASYSFYNHFFLLPLIAEEIGMDKQMAAWLVAIPSITGIIAKIGGGILIDKGVIRSSTALYVSFTTSACLGLAVSFTTEPWLLFGYMLLIGLVGDILETLLLPMMAQLVSAEHLASVSGLLPFLAGIAFFLGPPMITIVGESTGTYYNSLRVLAAFYVVSFCLLLFNQSGRFCRGKRKNITASRRKMYIIHNQDSGPGGAVK